MLSVCLVCELILLWETLAFTSLQVTSKEGITIQSSRSQQSYWLFKEVLRNHLAALSSNPVQWNLEKLNLTGYVCFPALPGLPGICIFCQSLCWSLHEELHHTDWKTVWYPKLPDWCYRWKLRNGYALFYWMQHVSIMVYINYRNLSKCIDYKAQILVYVIFKPR